MMGCIDLLALFFEDIEADGYVPSQEVEKRGRVR
jgi:hypothetical protein